jgi:hypothetical protein
MVKARAGGCKVIGIHIRHGDYATFEGGIYYYSLEQYAGLMKQIRSLFPDQSIRFLICSNAKFDGGDFKAWNTLPAPAI